MKHTTSLTNSQLNALIDDRIHNDRDRRLLRRRFIDGQTYDELSVEFFLSRRQVARIIARARSILTTEHPPDNGTKRALPRHCGGALFCFIMRAERRQENVRLHTKPALQPYHEPLPAAGARPARAAPAGGREGERRARRPGLPHGPEQQRPAAGRQRPDRVGRDDRRRRVQDRRALRHRAASGGTGSGLRQP